MLKDEYFKSDYKRQILIKYEITWENQKKKYPGNEEFVKLVLEKKGKAQNSRVSTTMRDHILLGDFFRQYKGFLLYRGDAFTYSFLRLHRKTIKEFFDTEIQTLPDNDVRKNLWISGAPTRTTTTTVTTTPSLVVVPTETFQQERTKKRQRHQ